MQYFCDIRDAAAFIFSHEDQEIDDPADDILAYFSDMEAELVDNGGVYDERWIICHILLIFAILDNNISKSLSTPTSNGIDQKSHETGG